MKVKVVCKQGHFEPKQRSFMDKLLMFHLLNISDKKMVPFK